MLTFLVVLTAHFIGDFVLQSNKMAINKSRSWGWLSWHVLVYTMAVAGILNWWLWFLQGFSLEPDWRSTLLVVRFFIMTFVTHFLTDAVTSRWTSKLWFIEQYGAPEPGPYLTRFVFNERKRHWFFVVIGFDQLIHVWTLAGTLWLVAA